MSAHVDPAVVAAIAAVDTALTEKLGTPYLVRKLDYLIREHRAANGVVIPHPRHEALARRALRDQSLRPGRHLIQEAI